MSERYAVMIELAPFPYRSSTDWHILDGRVWDNIADASDYARVWANRPWTVVKLMDVGEPEEHTCITKDEDGHCYDE